jgi:hypothetical protein
MALKEKFIVRLTDEQRNELERLAATGKRPAATTLRARIRKKFAQHGLEAAVQRKRPTGRLYRKLDGAKEARLAALACSPPPEGQARWTMKLLADKLVELEVVEAIDPATVCRTLKKTRVANLA